MTFPPPPYLGKSQPPSEQYPLGVTVDGVPITPGLAVWTNDMEAGVVIDDPARFTREHWDGWFEVATKPGARLGTLQNWERVATTFEGREASKEVTR
jgi:hypothetical protein